MANKNFIEQNPTAVKYAVLGGILYFGIVRPLLKAIHILPSPPVIEVKPDNQDPYSPLYWQIYAKNNPGKGLYLTAAGAEMYATRIHKAMADGWAQWTDDEGAIYDVFRNLKNWLQVSMVSDAFSKKYKTNLIDYLVQGDNQYSPWAGLNKSEMQTIKDIVSSKPKF